MIRNASLKNRKNTLKREITRYILNDEDEREIKIEVRLVVKLTYEMFLIVSLIN